MGSWDMETELPTGSQSMLRSFREKLFARCPVEMISQCVLQVRDGRGSLSPHFAVLWQCLPSQ